MTSPAFTSRYAQINVAGNFNDYSTTTNLLSLFSNNTWRGYITLNAYTNPAFLFVTNGSFGSTWKVTNQPVQPFPVSGTTITGGSGSDITLTGVISGTLMCVLDDVSGFYLADVQTGPWTSRFPYINLAGSFNGFNTTVPNMTLVTNGLWQSTVTFAAPATNPAFLFSTRNFGTTWKETDQTWHGPWLSGSAEQNSGSDITNRNVLTGAWQFQFNENTRAYTMEPVETNAIAWTSRYAYVNVAASFNGFETMQTNMTLISNGVWQGYASLLNVTNPYFAFATRGFTNSWKEVNQTVFTLPLVGGGEFNQGADIQISGVVNGLLRFRFDEKNGTYRVDDVSLAPPGGEPWINEIHYEHVGTDTNELVEVAGPAGLALSAYSVVLYNGSDGKAFRTNALSGSMPNNGSGFGAVSLSYNDKLQNGSPDGLALIKSNTTVLEFLSYEGVFKASNGPAVGVTSTDIGVTEDDSTPVSFSVQRIGTGAVASAFGWTGPLASSPGQLNVGQVVVNTNQAGSLIFSNLVHTPYSPGSNDEVYIEVDATAQAGASNLTVTAFFRINSNGLYQAASMSQTGSHFRTYRPIAAQTVGTYVEYYIFGVYDGPGTNCPQRIPTNAPASVQSYGISRVSGGAVWINEIDVSSGIFDGEDAEFIELAGLAGSDLSGWQLWFYDSDVMLYDSIVLPNGSLLANDDTGFGFFVVGDSAVPSVDLIFTNELADFIENYGGIQLRNEFGLLQQSIWFGTTPSPDGFVDLLFNDADTFEPQSASLIGTGGVASAFIWSATSVPSAGSTNDGQELTGGNTNDLQPILVCPSAVYLDCLSSPIPAVDVSSVVATGLCGDLSATVSYIGDVTNSGTGCFGSPKIITRTYQAISDCGTTSTCSQLITVEDRNGPVVSLLGGTQELVNAGFEAGTLQGWSVYGELSNRVSSAFLMPYNSFVHGRIVDPASAYCADASGSGFDGLIMGAPQRGLSSRGGLGTSFGFDGVDDRIDIPYGADLNNSTTFSFSVWVKPSAGTGTVRVALGSLTNRGYSLVLGSNNFWRFITGTNRHEILGPAATTLLWTHVVGVYSNQTKQLYINGVCLATNTGVSYVPNTSAVLCIGGQVTANGGASNLFKGTVDDVQIFSRALNAAEVTNLYGNAGAGGPTGALVEAHFKLNEASNAVGTVGGVYQGLPASSGQTWSVSGYLMTPGGNPITVSNQAVLELQYLNAATVVVQVVTSQVLSASSPTNVYVRYSASTVASANVAMVRAVVKYVRGSDSAGEVYFDSLRLSRFAFDPGTNCSIMLPDLRVNVSASDDCSVVSTSQVPAGGTTLSVGDHDVVFQTVDQCGQIGYATILVSVVDSVAPVITVSNITVTCDAQLALTSGVAVADCNTYNLYLLGETFGGGNGCSTSTARTITRILQAIDSAGYVSYATQVVSQVQTAAPSVSVANTGAIANASFEIGTALTNWTRFGAAFSSADSARTGTRSLKLAGQSGGGTNYNGAYQDLAAAYGQFWRASGWMRTPAVDPISPANQASLKLEFLDASAIVGTVTSRYFSVDDARDVYQPFSAQGVAPAGTERVRITVTYVQVTNASGLIYVDDVALNMTSLTSSNGVGAMPDMTRLVVSTNACSTPAISQLPVAGSVVTSGVTNITFVALDECGRSSTARVALVVGDEVVAPAVPPAPSNVAVQVFTMLGTNITLRSTGTNSWSVVAEYSTNLMGPIWQLVSNSVNSYSGGTNVTSFGHPVTNAGQGVIFRVRQTWP